MFAVGIDLGYGDTKVIGVGGRRERFPSRWAPFQSTKEWGMGGKILVLSVDGEPPTVAGESATNMAGVREPVGDGRLVDRGSLPILAAALWRTGAGANGQPAEVVLGSGTPLSFFQTEAPAAAAALQGRTFHLAAADGEERSITIDRVVMRPQGVGAALHLAAQGKFPAKSGIGVVIDIGSRTTDVLTLDLQTLEPIKSLSFSIEQGVGDAVARMIARIEEDTRHAPPVEVAREALGSQVEWRQRQVGGPEVAAPIYRDLADQIQTAIAQRLRANLSKVGAMAVVGGGAGVMGEALEALAPGTRLVVDPGDVQYANALGFQMVAEKSMGRKVPIHGRG